MSVLYIRGEDGTFQPIKTIKGDKGDKGDPGVFVTFDLALADGVKLTITDLGNDLVHLHLHAKLNQTGANLEFAIPSDNSDFVAWGNEKFVITSCTPVVFAGGVNAGTYAETTALLMADFSGGLLGESSVITLSVGEQYKEDPVERVIVDKTIKLIPVSDMQ